MGLIYFLFFFSGASALIYEVAWLRLLSLSFGNTTEAASCVISVFLGGLAVGAFFGGRLADRLNEGHLRAYGMLEVGIGLLAPIIGWLLTQLPSAVAHLSQAIGEGLGAQVWVRFSLATLILLLPTILMGASLPVLCRYLSVHKKFTKGFAALYAVNMLGSVFGCFDGCVLGFTYLGISGTIAAAAVLNIYVGLRAFFKKQPEVAAAEMSRPVQSDEPGESSDSASPLSKQDVWLLSILAFLSGFNALGFEVLWITFLKFYFIADTYTFAFTVSCFLLGLTIGSVICFSLRPNRPYEQKLRDLSLAQILTAIACGASLVALPFGAHWYHAGPKVLYYLLGVCLLLVTVPTIAIGLTFPLIGGLASSFRKVGTYVGLIFAVNTLGCVVGSLFVGMYAQPVLGSFVAFKLNVLLSTIISAIAMMRSLGSTRRAFAIASLLPVAAGALFFLYVPDSFLTALNKMKVPSVIFYGEDSTGIVWVMKHPDFKALKTNLALTSSTYMAAKRYMRLLGALPVLACKDPANALVVCFGTGTTAGATTAFEDVKHVDVVELSPIVLKASPCFADSNLNVLQNRKVSVHVNDGRNFLLNTRQQYDVITFEPPPLFSAGVVNLYSTEFYRLVKHHLRPDGVVAQWVPSFDISNPLWKMILQSFLSTFPHCSLWISNSGEGIILGSDKPIELDIKRMKAQIESAPQLRAALDEVGLSDPYSIIGTFVMADDKLRRYVGNAQPITDDHPYMEFYSPFLGRPLSDFEITQAAGNIEDELNGSVTILGAVPQKLENSFEAMRNFRISETRFWPANPHTPAQSKEGINQAIKLSPGNQFFPWYAKNGSPVPDSNPENF